MNRARYMPSSPSVYNSLWQNVLLVATWGTAIEIWHIAQKLLLQQAGSRVIRVRYWINPLTCNPTWYQQQGFITSRDFQSHQSSRWNRGVCGWVCFCACVSVHVRVRLLWGTERAAELYGSWEWVPEVQHCVRSPLQHVMSHAGGYNLLLWCLACTLFVSLDGAWGWRRGVICVSVIQMEPVEVTE